MPSNWLVFDRIRALVKRNRIFQAERPLQDQSQLDRIIAGGEFFEFGGQQSAILDQTNIQLGRLERTRDYELMDQTGEISLALDLYADEGSLIDSERKRTLIIRARNKRLKMELEDFLFNILRWDTYCRSTIRYLCKYGDCPFEIIPDMNRSGVAALRHMNVYNFTRIETRYGDLVGFFHNDIYMQKPQFMHPWQVVHMRLTSFENQFNPYGKSLLEGGRKAWRQLRLMEDASLISRLTKSPERRKFTIPVGLIPPKEIPEYMQMIARTFKRERFYNPSTGTFDERYSPLIAESDYFLPRRADGSGPDVEIMGKMEGLDQIKDIEYFKKKMIAPLKIPFARVGIGEGAGEASEKSLSQASSEFSKAVQWVQREVATGLTKACIAHLALRGYSVDDLRGFELALTATSAMEELYRIETWQTRVGVMTDLKDLGWFPKEWIVMHFTDLSPDEIEELREMESSAANLGGGGGGNPGGIDLMPEDDTGEQPLELGEPTQPLDPNQPIPPQPQPPNPLEGFDYQSERKLLNELRKSGDRKKINKLINEWASRLGKNSSKEYIINNGYDHLIESKELDGLSKNNHNNSSDIPYDPNSDSGLLVEWSVPESERNEIITEISKLLMLTKSTANEIINENEEITDDDLPGQ